MGRDSYYLCFPVLTVEPLQQVIHHVHQMADLRLGELLVRPQLPALGAHLLADQGGEDHQRDLLEPGVVLHQLSQPMAVHLGHLDVGDDQGHVLLQIPFGGQGGQRAYMSF